MKRTLALVGLAFLILAPPAHAQQDGEYQVKNNEVQATGNATDGTCEPSEFPLQIAILFGPGNKVETVQGTDQRTAGEFDRDTGKIKTASGPESYTLEPDGRKRLTGFNTYNDCRWTIDFKLNKPGLVFVKTEAAPDAASSPSAAPEAAAPPGATDDEKKDGGSTGGGLSTLAIAGIAGGVAVGGLVAYNALKNEKQSYAATSNAVSPGRNATTSTINIIASPEDAEPQTDEEIAKRLGDIIGTPDRPPPQSSPKNTPEPQKEPESLEPDLGDEIDPPNVRA